MEGSAGQRGANAIAPGAGITNRLFGADPDQLVLPFCALTPTITCSTALMARVMRHNPDMGAPEAARQIARAWALFSAGLGNNVVEVGSTTLRMLDLKERGSVRSHAPVHAAAFKLARDQARRTDTKEARAVSGRDRDGVTAAVRRAKMDEQTTRDRETSRKPWPHLKFPNKFVHTYTVTDERGRTWDKAICTVPPNTRVNGTDVGGFALDAFMRDFHMEAKTLGRPVVLMLDPEKPVELFKGKGGERRTRIVKPWDLATGLAKGAEAYREARQAQRESAVNEPLSEQHEASVRVGAPQPSQSERSAEAR